MGGIPSWVSDGSIRKYYRAVTTLAKLGKEPTDEAVKELYIKDAGLVVGVLESVAGTDNPEPLMAVAEAEVKIRKGKK